MAEHFGVYFTDDKNVTIELPVSPEEITLALERNNEIVEILKLGEINRIGEAKLKEISIASSFPVEPRNAQYTTANGTIHTAGYYISFFENWHNRKKAGRFTVSTTKLNIRMTIERFEYGFRKGNIDEYVYTLDLKEWKDYSARTVPVVPKPTPPPPPPRPAPPKKIGIGSTVIVNGQLHVDSYGSGPGQVERNAKRKINFINSGAPCPYHCTTMEGGWRGWVTAGSVKAV